MTRFDSSAAVIAMVVTGACFIFYLIYTRQFKWLFGVLKNSALGVAGLLLGNLVLAPMGFAVGINLLTVFIVTLLGIPGLLLLFVTSRMV